MNTNRSGDARARVVWALMCLLLAAGIGALFVAAAHHFPNDVQIERVGSR